MPNDFIPPPSPSADKPRAAKLIPILEKQPGITFSQFRKLYPEISMDTLINGLLELFDDLLHGRDADSADLAALRDAMLAALQVDALKDPHKHRLSNAEVQEVTTLAAAAMDKHLQGRRAGLALMVTTLAAASMRGPAHTHPAELPVTMAGVASLNADPEEKKPRKKGGKKAAEAKTVFSTANLKAPSQYSVLTDAISRNLARLLPDENEVYVGTAPGKDKRSISSVVTMDFPSAIQVEGGYLTSYDKAILNGVSSLLLAGTFYFTIPMLYHAMTGIENPSMNAAATENLRSRLEYMRRTMIRIDCTDEAAAHFLGDDVQKFVISQYLLPMGRIEAVLNGREVVAYYLMDKPPLYQYASSKRQLSLVDLSLLSAPLNNNASTIVLKNYILSRIEGMKNPRNHLVSHKILFASVFQELGEPEPTKLRRKRIRDYTETFLDYLVTKQYIRSYRLTRDGRTIDGVEIRLRDDTICLAPQMSELAADPPAAKPTKIKPKPRTRHRLEDAP